MLYLLKMGCGRSKAVATKEVDSHDTNNASHQQKNGINNSKENKDNKKSHHNKKSDSKSSVTSIDSAQSKNGKLHNTSSSPTHENELEKGSIDGEAHEKDLAGHRSMFKDRPMPSSGPLQSQIHVTASQTNFFRMLDEKIEQGKEYIEEETVKT